MLNIKKLSAKMSDDLVEYRYDFLSWIYLIFNIEYIKASVVRN
jgi:hypothetical protein